MSSRMSSNKAVGLVVAADEPALFFSSPATAEEYLEAVDVHAGTYPESYGPAGGPFEISVDPFNKVVIIKREDCPYRPERMREIVERFLRACGISYSEDMTNETLLKLCSPYVDDGS